MTLFWLFSFNCFILQHRRPYLPTYGYLGFPQGYPSYPQDYPDVGTAEQLLPVATQPFAPVVPHDYPSSSVYPGIASPDYPGPVSMKV